MIHQKTGEKTGAVPKAPSQEMRSPLTGARCPTGRHPGNTGGKKGRSGRPPNELRAFLAALRSDPAVQAALRAALLDHTSRGFGVALRILAAYDEDKPAQKQQIVGPLEVQVRFAKEGRRTTAS